MMDKNQLQQIQLKVGKDFVEVLTKELIREKKKSSGKLINSLKPEIKQIGEQLQILINGEDYINAIDKGRKRGKFPPVDKITEWCSIKGIPKSAAWAIATNIYKFGIKPTNVIAEAQQKFMQQEQSYLDTAFVDVINEEIKNMFDTK